MPILPTNAVITEAFTNLRAKSKAVADYRRTTAFANILTDQAVADEYHALRNSLSESIATARGIIARAERLLDASGEEVNTKRRLMDLEE